MNLDMVPEGPKHIPPYISRNQSSLGELLLGFLKYYATDFRYLPMSIMLSGSLPCWFSYSLSSSPTLLANSSSLSVLRFSSLSSVPLPPPWFHVSCWGAGAGETFGLTQYYHDIPRSLSIGAECFIPLPQCTCVVATSSRITHHATKLKSF